MIKNTPIKLNNKKAWVVKIVNEKGFVSYKRIMSITGWDLNNLHSTFRANVLLKCGLEHCIMNGNKGYRIANKSETVRALLSNRQYITARELRDVTLWDNHTLNSVFRNTVLNNLGVVKVNIGKKTVYKAA